MTELWVDGAGIPIDYTPNPLHDELVEAARAGDMDRVKAVLEKGAAVDYWPTPSSCSASFEETVYQSAAIEAACKQGHLQIVLTLYKHSKRKEYIKDYWPILMETLKNRWHLRQVPIMGVNGDMVYVFIDHFTYHIFFMISPPILKYLITEGADVNVNCPSGRTPLMMAAGCLKNPFIVRVLVEAGADVNLKDVEDFSALTHAVKFGNVEAIEYLLENGAKANTTVSDYPYNPVCFPLLFAIARGNINLIELLMKYKIQPTNVSQFLLYKLQILDFGDLVLFSKMASPLYVALYAGQPEIARLFMEKHFITKLDVAELPRDRELRERLTSETEGNPECFGIFQNIESKPWPLFNLCFLTVSEIIGFESGREERLETLGLPPRIVRKFLFIPL